MERLSLREAATRTSRSITTLRRYIRSGRLHADKRHGRFGPEYFVTERDLTEAGLEPEPVDRPSAALSRRPETLPRPRSNGTLDSVPLTLYQELQMKHEQLLVQYGMIRAGGVRAVQLQAELEAQRDELERRQATLEALRRESRAHIEALEEELRRSRLELEARALEISALEEKLLALEIVTRNAATNESVNEQFEELLDQARRARGLRPAEPSAGRPGWTPDIPGDPPDH